MRIEERKSVSVFNILPDHRLQQSGLAGARFPDDVHMCPPIGAPNAEDSSVTAEVGSGEVGNKVWVAHISLVFPCRAVRQGRLFSLREQQRWLRAGKMFLKLLREFFCG